MSRFRKDPDAILDYQWNWFDWLQPGEVIISHSIIVPSGITLDSSAVDGPYVVAWLRGGTNGQTYIVTCRITTDQGRTDDRSMELRMLDK
jgi:hypothetical protein